MAITIDSAYVSQFRDNLHMLLEQRGSKLRSVFPVEMARGEKHFFDRLGNIGTTEITGRNTPVTFQDAAHSRRMCTLKKFFSAVPIDDLDKMQMLIDPTNDYAIKIANALGREFDNQVLAAMIGSAATGKDGAGSQAFDTSNNQIAHGSTGLTVSKFDQALRILQTNEVDLSQDELVLIVNARGIEDLFGDNSNKLTSADFQANKVLAGKGELMYRGVRIMHCERVPDHTAGSVYRGLLTTRDSLKVAMARELEVEVEKRPDLVDVYQVIGKMAMGAVRMEEARVVDILFQ
jgi:hypothetical protein